MKQLYLFLILNFICTIVGAQDSILNENNIFKTQQLKKGIYYNYNQFKLNSPIPAIDFELKPLSKKKNDVCGRVNLIFNSKYVNSTIDTLHNHIWGFCTGEGIYINNELVSSIKGFDHLMKLNSPISYFYSFILVADEGNERATFPYQFGALGIASALIPYSRLIALDNRNGEIILLNNKGFNKLFKDDEAIMRRYNNVKDNNDKDKFLIFLIDEYNQKHKNN